MRGELGPLACRLGASSFPVFTRLKPPPGRAAARAGHSGRFIPYQPRNHLLTSPPSPGYVRAMADLIEAELDQFPTPPDARVFFSAHGVPRSYVVEAGDPYKEEMVRLGGLWAGGGWSSFLGDLGGRRVVSAAATGAGGLPWRWRPAGHRGRPPPHHPTPTPPTTHPAPAGGVRRAHHVGAQAPRPAQPPHAGLPEPRRAGGVAQALHRRQHPVGGGAVWAARHRGLRFLPLLAAAARRCWGPCPRAPRPTFPPPPRAPTQLPRRVGLHVAAGSAHLLCQRAH
jgi:hypothetical protein